MRQVLPIVGAAVGAYFGGAQGAQLGWAIGSMVGNAVDPQVIKGPSIGDLSQQTAQEGTPRAIVFGLSQPISGNIVACSQPKIVTHRQSQGKGSGPVTTSQSVLRTYAVAICEGPITAVIRVWANGKLVYDAREGGDPSGNAYFLANSQIFLGTYDQMPSAQLEVIFGAGKVPAMRGTAYIAWHDIDLTSQGGAVPQYVFQVMRCEGKIYTSNLYAIEDIESMTTHSTFIKPLEINFGNNHMTVTSVVQGIDLVVVADYVTYSIPHDDLQPLSAFQAGVLTVTTGYRTYSIPEENFTASSTIHAIEQPTVAGYVAYLVPADNFTVSSTFQSGVLT